MSSSLELFGLRDLNKILHSYFKNDVRNSIFITMKNINKCLLLNI